MMTMIILKKKYIPKADKTKQINIKNVNKRLSEICFTLSLFYLNKILSNLLYEKKKSTQKELAIL